MFQRESPQEFAGTGGSEACLVPITPEMDRRNGLIYFVSNLLFFLSAPVCYVDVVQAALCDKLGASATVANLPASAYLLGCVAPIFVSWATPYRLERSVVVVVNFVSSIVLALVCLALILPLENSVRIAAVIGQGLTMGILGSVTMVYMFQCLGRGTTDEGRARALKLTYGLSPIAAVAGSLGAQFVLNRGISSLAYPHDFAFLYFVGVLCMAFVAWLSTLYLLAPVLEVPRLPFFGYIWNSVNACARDPSLVRLWFAFVLWYCSLGAISNLSLYVKFALRREPTEFSGLIMALRFGFKSGGGFVLGVMAIRWGMRAPVTATVLLLAGALLWAWLVPGYLYLITFGLMGAGELGGAYFPNYVVAISSTATGARNLSLLMLATPVASIAPALHGILSDTFGFPGSFLFGLTTAGLSLWLVLKLPAQPSRKADWGITLNAEHA